MATTTINRSAPQADYRVNVYFQDGAVLTGILAALLFLTVTTSLDAAGHVTSMALLIPVTLGAILLGILMAYSRFDGFFALSHSMFTGLAWILFLMAGLVSEKEITSFLDFGIPETQAKVYYILWKLLNWVDAALSNNASNDNYVFIFEIAFLSWWLTYLGIWAIFRYGYTWRAIIPAGVVLLINAYYAPKPVTGFLGVFAMLAFVFLVRTNLAEQQLRWREQRVYFSQDIALDFLRNGFYYSMLVLAFAWLAPGLGRNPLIRDLMAPVNYWWEGVNQEVSSLYEGTYKKPRAGGAMFGNTLSLGGERNVESTPVFTVVTSNGRYWRAVVFDTFDGRQWQNTLSEETDFSADTTLPVPSWELRTPITQTFTLMAGMGNVIVASPDIRSISESITAIGQSSPAASLTAIGIDPTQGAAPGYEISYARATGSLDAGDSYTVVSQFSQVTKQALTGAGTAYPQAILDTYLQLPQNFSELVAQTAISVTTGMETPYAKAKAIETFLRTYEYDDAIPAPPSDQDPIEYFLFQVKRGYCDYYATAMAMMLRYLGVPARTASGYAEGTYDEENGQFWVTDADAHTWVEVFFPNYGWIEFEPTAGESPLDRPDAEEVSGNAGAEGAASDPANLSSADNPYQDPFQDELLNQQAGSAGATDNSGNSPWWLWALLTPLLLAVGVFGLRRMQLFGPTVFTPELSPILFERLQRWSERLGLRMHVSDTPYEQARSLGAALPEGQPYIHEITDTYVRYRFSRQNGATPPNNGAASDGSATGGHRLVEAWQQLQPMLWRAWGRKVTAAGRRRRRNNPFSLTSE